MKNNETNETTITIKTERTPEFKAQIVREATAEGANKRQVARDHGIEPNLVYRWCTESEKSTKKKPGRPKQLQLTGPTNAMMTTTNLTQDMVNNLRTENETLRFTVDKLTNDLNRVKLAMANLYVETRAA